MPTAPPYEPGCIEAEGETEEGSDAGMLVLAALVAPNSVGMCASAPWLVWWCGACCGSSKELSWEAAKGLLPDPNP